MDTSYSKMDTSYSKIREVNLTEDVVHITGEADEALTVLWCWEADGARARRLLCDVFNTILHPTCTFHHDKMDTSYLYNTSYTVNSAVALELLPHGGPARELVNHILLCIHPVICTTSSVI